MKKAVTILVVFMLVAGVLAMSFKDVPKNHWAYEAVNALSDLEIIMGYPDGTFKGSQVVTRYQLAVALYRTIEYLRGLIGGTAAAAPKASTMGSSEKLNLAFEKIAKNEIAIANLEKLVADLRKKISGAGVVAAPSSEAEAALSIAKKVAEKADENAQAILEIKSKLETLEMSVKSGESAKLPEDVSKKLENLLATVSGMKMELSEMDALKDRYGTLSKKLIVLEQDVREAKDKTGELERGFADLSSRVAGLNGELQDVKAKVAKVDEVGKKVGDLEKRVSEVEKKVESVQKGGMNLWDFVSIASLALSLVTVVLVLTGGGS